MSKINNIYIISSYNAEGGIIYKVGFSNNIAARISNYTAHNPSAVLTATYYHKDGINFERALHKSFTACYKNEWYDKATMLSIKDILEGVTEFNLKPVNKVKRTIIEKMLAGCKVNFAMVCESYNTSGDLEKKQIEKLYPLVKEAYDKLGVKRIKALEYRQTAIKKELLLQNKLSSKASKISSVLDLRVGQWVSLKELKTALQEAYDEVGIVKKAKASDIDNYYSMKPLNRREGSKFVRGGVVMMNLYK